jgi:thioredoxin 1
MNRKQFQEKIQSGVSLIEFSAPWCAPCFVQKPIIESLSKKFSGKAFVTELNVDEHRESALEFGITSIPTTILFLDGREVDRYVGLQEAKVLSKAIGMILARSS